MEAVEAKKCDDETVVPKRNNENLSVLFLSFFLSFQLLPSGDKVLTEEEHITCQ